MKILNILYYIFIFPFLYIGSILLVVFIQCYSYFADRKHWKKICRKNGHVWQVQRGRYGIERDRKCTRCGKKQWFNLNSRNWNE